MSRKKNKTVENITETESPTVTEEIVAQMAGPDEETDDDSWEDFGDDNFPPEDDAPAITDAELFEPEGPMTALDALRVLTESRAYQRSAMEVLEREVAPLRERLSELRQSRKETKEEMQARLKSIDTEIAEVEQQLTLFSSVPTPANIKPVSENITQQICNFLASTPNARLEDMTRALGNARGTLHMGVHTLLTEGRVRRIRFKPEGGGRGSSHFRYSLAQD